MLDQQRLDGRMQVVPQRDQLAVSASGTFFDAGGIELIGPPMKSILNCNWKTPTENFGGDDYHFLWIDPEHPERRIAEIVFAGHFAHRVGGAETGCGRDLHCGHVVADRLPCPV